MVERSGSAPHFGSTYDRDTPPGYPSSPGRPFVLARQALAPVHDGPTRSLEEGLRPTMASNEEYYRVV